MCRGCFCVRQLRLCFSDPLACTGGSTRSVAADRSSYSCTISKVFPIGPCQGALLDSGEVSSMNPPISDMV